MSGSGKGGLYKGAYTRPIPPHSNWSCSVADRPWRAPCPDGGNWPAGFFRATDYRRTVLGGMTLAETLQQAQGPVFELSA